MQWQNGSNRGTMRGTLLIAVACSIQVAVAAPVDQRPATPILDQAQVVPEHELAHQRGRFAQGGKVVRFGLRMASQLQSATGEMVRGGVDFRVDMSSSEPQVSFTPTMAISNRSDSTPDNGDSASRTDSSHTSGNRSPGNEGSNGTGIVQRVQVAGDANSAVNDMRIDVVEQMGHPASGDPTDNTDVALYGANGSSVEISTGKHGMNLKLDIPGSGQVSQRVISGQGVEQLIQLSGELNRASSIARLRVELQETLSGNTASMRQALDSIDTLR